MSLNTFLSSFTQAGHAPYLPDLTLWYRWHCERQTLPAAWRDATLAEIAAALGVAAWLVEKLWRLEHHGVTVIEREAAGERVIRYEAASGVLVARWSVGPDGDWWQAEYPVKTAEDLPAALEVVKARTYVVESANQQISESANGGSALRNTQYATRHTPTIRALELPMQPYSDLLHTLFGWGDGLMLMRGEGAEIVQQMLAVLAEKLAGCAGEIAALPGDVLLAPDNLDGQYISPRDFQADDGVGLPAHRRDRARGWPRTDRPCRRAGAPLARSSGRSRGGLRGGGGACAAE